MLHRTSVYDLNLPLEHDVIEEFSSSLDSADNNEVQKNRMLLRDLHRVLMVLEKSARSQFMGNYTVYSILALLALHEDRMKEEQAALEEMERTNPRHPRLRLRKLQPLTQTNISHMIGIRPQSLGSILQDMEDEGFIVRSKHKDDRRALHASLTEKGREHITALKHSHDTFACSVLKDLSIQEKEDMSRILQKIMSGLMLH